jgi:Leucine-rich repeat
LNIFLFVLFDFSIYIEIYARSHEDVEKKISFAYHGLQTISNHLLSINTNKIEYLDLTENHFDDLRFLIDWPNLRTLIVDKNRLTSNLKLPHLNCLHTLWINENHITNLTVFLQTLIQHCPQLKYLSMMKNPAAPSFFNGGTYQQYVDYRYYVISQLSRLIMLDDRQVSLEERQEAERIHRPMSLLRRKRPSSTSLLPTSQ